MGNAKLCRILRFRMGSHHLPVEEDRHYNLPRASRVYKLCNTGLLGDERYMQGSTRALFWPGLPSPGSKFREGFALTKFAGSANLQGLPSHSCRNGKGLKILHASNPTKQSTANVHIEFHQSCPLPN